MTIETTEGGVADGMGGEGLEDVKGVRMTTGRSGNEVAKGEKEGGGVFV